ncbi:membrane protein of unknown function [Methanocaldococcus lauensis]|nr:membrane protein of unknown function [Methanocaldococcus lauensis]
MIFFLIYGVLFIVSYILYIVKKDKSFLILSILCFIVLILQFLNINLYLYIFKLLLIMGIIITTLYILRKDKFLLFLAVFGLIIPFLQFDIPKWLFNILSFSLFIYVKLFVPKNMGGSYYYSPFVVIPLSMYGWILIGLIIKIIYKYLNKLK